MGHTVEEPGVWPAKFRAHLTEPAIEAIEAMMDMGMQACRGAT